MAPKQIKNNLKKNASSFVKNPQLNTNKTAPTPDVPVHAASVAQSAGALGTAAQQGKVTSRQVAYRFPQFVEAVKTMLGEAGVRRLRRDSLRKVGRYIASWLGDRRLASLDEKELAELASELRRYFAVNSGGARKLLETARKRAQNIKGAVSKGVTASTVDMPEGVWVYTHTGSTDPVIVAEAFIPRRIGGSTPPRPPFPGPGKPRWLRDDGSLSETALAVPVNPDHVPTGPPAGILDQAPDILIDQFRRAERRRSGQAWVSLTDKVVKFFGDVPNRWRRTLGLGIDSINVTGLKPSATRTYGERAWDALVVIKGRTGKSPVRFPDADILPEVGEVFGTDAHKWARLHAWGPILGDSTPAGIAYGPVELNKVQRETIEAYLQTWSNPKAPVELEVSVYLSYRRVDTSTHPFVNTVKYKWVDSAGEVRQVAIGIGENGKIFRTPEIVPP